MADVLAMADIHTAPVVNSGFNVSYLTTNVYEWTKRFMTLPGRVMERIHLLEELLQEDPYQQAEAIATAAREGRTDVPFRRSAIRMSGTTLPGPWGFFVSGYAVVVVILMFLLNRIHHIITPARESRRRSRQRSWSSRFFPLDMESTRTRFITRFPTMYLLIRAYLLWMLVTVQAVGLISDWPILKSLDDKGRNITMDSICWTTFIAICAALVGNHITRGLEGRHASQQARPFNIAGYAFMMYLYSQPVSHVNKPADGASRPDIHVLIMVSWPLLEMTIMHCLNVKPRWGRKRLYPTAFCSMLNLIHYHYVLWFSNSQYPLISFFHGAIETGLLSVIAVTIGLRVFAQLASTGEVRGPLLGHAATWSLPPEEDFSLTILRLGTAALDITAVAGLANEVGTITTPPLVDKTVVELGATDAKVQGSHRRGLENEIKTVRAKTAEQDPAQGGAYYREVSLFALAAWRCAKLLFRYLSAFVRRQPLPSTTATDATQLASSLTRLRRTRLEDEHALYDRFRRGEVDDDDDDEWSPGTPLERVTSSVSSDEDDEDNVRNFREEDEWDGFDTDETPQLYEELTSHPTSASVMLAHLSNTSASPLTRLRYRRIAAGQAHEDDHDTWLQQQRANALTHAQARDEYDEARRWSCVICTTEPRSIILWPCRCLALCEDCRGNLSSRSSASKHSCPCCRQHVDGYSRIYIP